MENYELKGDKNPKILSVVDDEVLKFYLGKSELSEPETFEYFVKSVEDMVRKDPRYTNYISGLYERGLNCDVMQSGITAQKFPRTALEMHHGPIFTLYDTIGIVTDHLLYSDEKVNSFKVARIVLKEHELHNIQVVMALTKTNHELVHAGKMFIHINQSFGDVLTFMKKYKNGIRRDHLHTLEEYLKLCKKYDATDNDYLCLRKVGDKVRKYMDKK